MPYCTPSSPQFSYLDTPEFNSLCLHISGCLAIPLHLFGAYCILFKTPESMKSVKFTMINFHFSTLVLDLVVSVLVGPYLLAPEFAIAPMGLLEGIGVDGGVQICLILVTGEGDDFLRHPNSPGKPLFVLTDSKGLWSKIRKPWFLTGYIGAVLAILPIYLTIPEDQEKAKSTVFENLPCLPPHLHQLPFFVMAENLQTTIVSLLIFINIQNIQTLYFSYRITCALKLHESRLSGRTLRIQKQFFHALRLQIFIPLMTMGAPLAWIFFEWFFGFYAQFGNNFAFITFSAYGLFSTALMLLVHAPYREFVMKFLRIGGPKKKESISSVVVSSVTSTKNI